MSYLNNELEEQYRKADALLRAVGVRVGPDSGTAATTPGVWTHDLAIQPAQVGGSQCFVVLHFTGTVFEPPL